MVSEWSKERAWKARTRDKRVVGSNPTRSAIFPFQMTSPLSSNPSEDSCRSAVLTRILDHIREDRRIFLPSFDPSISRPSDQFALQSVGIEPNDFAGGVGPYRYQFEGEEDLLHLIVTKQDGSPLTAQEGQTVAGYLLAGVPPALIWLKPGAFTQHFYIGHDELLDNLQV